VTGIPGDDVAIVGLGNVLMGDDAFGPYMIAVLEAAYAFPRGVALIDAGTPGHELSVYLEGRDLLIVVDAVRAPGNPGELRTYSGAEVKAGSPALLASPHEPGLREALLKLDFCGRGPRRVLLVGVIPSSLESGADLSEPVSGAIPEAESAIIAALAGYGIAPARKIVRLPPDIWWKRPPFLQ
jgi:hydrogenase maturation protease